MASRAATLRNAVIEAIYAAKSGLAVPGFAITRPGETHSSETSDFHAPTSNFESLTDTGRVWVVALIGDQDVPQTRDYSCLEHIPIQVCYLCRLPSLSDNDALDARIELCEQLRKVVRKTDVTWCSWMKTEAERDENGTPYPYRLMREDMVFMCVFTAYFDTFLTSEE